MPATTVAAPKADAALLTKVLTCHVVAGQLTPEQVLGMHATVEGAPVDVTGTPGALEGERRRRDLKELTGPMN